MTAHPITHALRDHYGACFEAHGATPAGVDWGTPESVDLRYANMLAVIDPARSGKLPSLLDVGCGYAGLLTYAKRHGPKLLYSGVDVCERMVACAKQDHPDAELHACDLFDLDPGETYDYVVCSGILTQKLAASNLEMAAYAREIVRRMWTMARHGIAFNAMTSHANFYAPNLFYWNPVEALGFCMELSRRVRLDQSYPLYEFTAYVYR